MAPGGPGLHPELAGGRLVRFPLAGEWVAVQTPGSRIPSHGTDILGQRYAFDLMRLDPETNRYHPASALRQLTVGVPTRECLGWDEPVLSVLDGEVVTAVDGVPEPARVHPVRDAARVLRAGLTFRPTADRVLALLGNHVVVRSDDVYAVFAHLRPGSVTVRAGEPVRAGAPIGRLGHTGNSMAPHLHFQLMDRLDPFQARGVPCRFEVYEVMRDGLWRRAEADVPTRRDRIRSATGGVF